MVFQAEVRLVLVANWLYYHDDGSTQLEERSVYYVTGHSLFDNPGTQSVSVANLPNVMVMVSYMC